MRCLRSSKYLFSRLLGGAEYLPLLCRGVLLEALFCYPSPRPAPPYIYTYAGRVGGRKKRSAPAYIYSFYSYHTTMKTPIISSSPAAQSSVPSLIFRAYTVKELACLYFPQKTATGASRSLRALIRHDPELLSQLRAQGYRPRVHYLPPSAVQVLLEHLGTPDEFYEILRKA